MSSAVVIDVNQRLSEIETEINLHLKRQVEDVLAVGKLAAEAKSLIPHGGYTAWIENRLRLSPTLVRAYVRVFERFGGSKTANFAALGVSSILLLASPSVSDGTIAEVEARLETGQRLTTSEVEQIITSHRVIEGAGLGAKALLQTYGDNVKQVSGAALRSLVQVSEDATQRGMVTINGDDYVATAGLPAAVQQAVTSATKTRQEAHIGENADEIIYQRVRVQVAANVTNDVLVFRIKGASQLLKMGDEVELTITRKKSKQ